MKRILSLLLLPFALFASEVTTDDAARAAKAWVDRGYAMGKLPAGREVSAVDEVEDPATGARLLVAKFEGGGYVVLSADDLILGGAQTNVAEEIAINAGSLQLGTASTPCTLAKNLPIRIYANATLKLPNADSTAGKLLYFDGAAGWFGKVEIAEGVAAQVKKAFVRDYPESPEWETLPRGYYSGDEATANSVDKCVWDPVHFSGSGVIRIVQDECIDATLMILR